ncbi:MAG: 4-(cytidine 5'-diphospho)-2-C-methyl-D-erythritol kinase [Granulosicoccaceae bacterium]|jgi:4-diphosphocytidyl-2-C-methyl-D-erythritol kinase
MSRVSRGWPAPAKLNLFLHITGRRADGYHELQTVFQLLDSGDSIDFTLRDDGRVCRTSGLPGVAEADDLVVRAARALQQAAGCRMGADIHVHKHLPAGGGLGGGSSNAATVLVALNHLWGTGLDSAALCRIGLALGADVPVFVLGHTAWAEGIGEKLEPLELPERWFVVLCPAVHVSTTEVFSEPQLTRDCAPKTIRNLLSGQGKNVCEAVVRKRYPEVAETLDWLAGQADARLTGTGACVFAAFDDEAQAQQVFAIRPQGLQGFVARGCNQSPLLARLEKESDD